MKRQGFENRNVTPLDRFCTYVPLRKFSGKPHNRFSFLKNTEKLIFKFSNF